MNFQFSKQAVKALARLDASTKRRFQQEITDIPQGDIKPLKSVAGTYRLRIGDWRILFSYPAAETTLVEKIAPRGDVYKRM